MFQETKMVREQLDFLNETAELFAFKKVLEYAKIEIDRNATLMGEVLAGACLTELALSIYETIHRIISYEYNSMIDQNVLAKENVVERVFAFRKIVMSEQYSKDFDAKYYVFAQQQKELLKGRAAYWHEIFTNYAKHRTELCSYFDRDFGDITAIHCSQGDLHDGKSVARVEFKNGQLLYKPRNENNAELMKQVIEYLASGTEITDYRFIEYFQREDISWEKIVNYDYCDNEEEVKDYYYRGGVMEACFYLLGSFDMHHENVIACGPYPVIIDCETIAKAQLHEKIKMDSKDVRVSVLASSFLPYVNDKNPMDINVSGLFPEKGVSKLEQASMEIGSDGIVHYLRKNIEVEEEKNIVRTKTGDTISDYEAGLQIKKGFEAACRFLIHHKTELIELIRDFCREKDIRFRQILRGTQAYFTFIRASNHPQLLSDADKRDDMFDILRRKFVASQFGYIRVQHEIAELKKGNIPLYYTTPCSKDLMSSGRVICRDFFTECPLDTISERINNFDEEMLEYQLQLIDKSVFIVQGDEFFGRSSVPEYYSDEKMNNSWIMENVIAYAEYLKKSEFRIDNNVSSMECVGFSRGKRIFSMGDINYAIYENGAFPLFLAYYGIRFGDNAAIEVAKRYTELFILEFKGMQTRPTEKDNLSVFVGFGGVLYVTFNMYAATKDIYYLTCYMEEARFIIDRLSQRESFTPDDFDFLNGAGATIYFICRTVLNFPDKLDELRMPLMTLLERLTESIAEIDFTSTGFAHGITGVAVELAMFNRLLNKSFVNVLIENLLVCENELNAGRYSEQMEFYTWCNGKSGLALGRHLISEFAPVCNTDIVNPVNWKYWIEDEDWYTCDNFCLCHGMFGNIEIANIIAGKDNLQYIRDRKRPFDRIEDIVWIKDFPYNFENFMAGGSGIAYVMLELLGAAPPILSLGIYEYEEFTDEKS